MFQTTRWSLILAARDQAADHSAALEQLCRQYRAPVHAFIRRVVARAEEAEDLTQAFFLTFIEQRFDAAAVRERGRFRVYLLATVKHFLANAHDYATRIKRGGCAIIESLDENLLDGGSADETPEHAFERVWALTVLDHAVEQMREEAIGAGKLMLFDRLREFLVEAPDSNQYEQIGADLGMKPNAVAVTVHRLRERLKERVRAVLLETVRDPRDVEAELRSLRRTLVNS